MKPKTVMLVDDDDRFVRRMRQFIDRLEGLSVIDTASSAEEALRRVGRLRPSFIISDIRMKGMSGLEAIGALKAASPGSSVIVVSSMPVEYAERAMRLGAIGYVEKRRVAEDLPSLLQQDVRNGETPAPKPFGTAENDS